MSALNNTKSFTLGSPPMPIPDELLSLKQFVVWKYETKEGESKPTKVPYNPYTGNKASTTNPNTWAMYAEAARALESGAFSGVGLVITKPYVGIDFDYCIDESGKLDERIAEAVNWFNSYTEVSPSGTGLHILLKGSFSGPGFNRVVDGRKIEVYQEGRYFTLTGNQWNGLPETIEDRTDSVRKFYLYIQERTAKPVEDRPVSNHIHLILEDSEIIEKIRSASNGPKFDRLYAGDKSEYINPKTQEYDDSAADEALCYMIAFYTKDYAQIDRIFRSSALYRQKWERSSYSAPTINNAINNVSGHYNPNHNSGKIIWGNQEYSAETKTQNDSQPAIGMTDTSERDEQGPINRTDVGNAIRLVRKFGADIRYCFAWEKWLVWDGTRWKIDDVAALVRMAKETARDILFEAAEAVEKEDRLALIKWSLASESSGRIKSMIELAQSEIGIPVQVDDLNANPFSLNLKNGTLDLLTGEMRAHRREDLITKICPAVYDPTEKGYVFDEFLQTIFKGDSTLIEFIRRAVGYSLTGDVKEQALFMCYGIGANGKSTFLDIITELMGDYAQSLPMQSLMMKYNDGGVPNDIAKLTGARFVGAVETDEGKRLSESLIKQLTGGDRISARFMRAEFFDFKPSFKIWMGVNHRPVITGTDYGIWRRVKLIPFDVVIPESERDTELPDKLRAEMSGILNWALAGCLEWGNRGLQIPDCVKLATEEYRHDMDKLADFIQERCNVGDAFRARSSELYQAYKQWTEQEGARALDSKKFKLQMLERGFTAVRQSDGIYIHGITLLSVSQF
jgi:putative DNA primase/helicase